MGSGRGGSKWRLILFRLCISLTLGEHLLHPHMLRMYEHQVACDLYCIMIRNKEQNQAKGVSDIVIYLCTNVTFCIIEEYF